MRTIELTITGFTNLSNFFDSLNDDIIEDLSHYCDHREENQDNNIYIVQYTLTD